MTRADVEVVVHMTVREAQAVRETLETEEEGHATHPVWDALGAALDDLEQTLCP